jgi:hypothetical protein
MEFYKLYQELMEDVKADIDPNSYRLRVGSEAEEKFYRLASAKYKVVKATPFEDKNERWDYKLYENANGKSLPAFSNVSLNINYPTISKLKGTVDVKSASLKGELTPIYLVSNGRGTSWCRGINWVAVPEGSSFRLIHCNALMGLLKLHAGIVVENPDETNSKIISTKGIPIRFANSYNDVNTSKGILFEHPTNYAKAVLIKTNALRSISILL